jgi:hypothetical protein
MMSATAVSYKSRKRELPGLPITFSEYRSHGRQVSPPQHFEKNGWKGCWSSMKLGPTQAPIMTIKWMILVKNPKPFIAWLDPLLSEHSQSKQVSQLT